MAKVLRPIGHEDRLSVVDHLDELRSRLIVCLVAFVAAFGICFWQNGPLIHLLRRALPNIPSVSGQNLASLPSASAKQRAADIQQARLDRALAASPGVSAAVRQQAGQAAKNLAAAAKTLPKNVQTQEKPITLGPAEAFTTTLTAAAYFALLFSLPVLMFQAYGFVLPALNRNERKTAVPIMVAAPLLFLIGIAFAYVVVLPPALHFLQGYNAEQFQVLVQAKSLFTFEILTMLGIGVAFQMPLGMLALHRLGVIDGRTLTKHWRYVVVLIAVIAAALPGADPVTTGLETLPLVVLFLASIVLLKIADRRAAAAAAAEAAQQYDGGLGIPS